MQPARRRSTLDRSRNVTDPLDVVPECPARAVSREQTRLPGLHVSAILDVKQDQMTSNQMTSKLTAANDEPADGGEARLARAPTADALALIKSAGLRHVSADVLSIRRRRCGKGWIYLTPDDRRIKDHAMVRRLARLAVPPAYQDVLYAEDPTAHLQAIGRDSEGRLQYRYHPGWEKVREIRKARRLARLADALPRIHRGLSRHLAATEPTRHFTFAAVIDLVARTAIRPGQRELRAPAWNAWRRHPAQVERFDLWRNHHADVPRQGR
jgi:hypothetical protein